MFSRIAYGLSALLIGVSALAGIQFSSAEWTDNSRTPMGISAARDWTPPMIAVVDPGFVISGTHTITAVASDAMTSVTAVTLEYAESGTGSWTTLCTAATAPYSCSWDTWRVDDGEYDLRASAVDAEGNSATSDIVTTEVANSRAVVLDPIPSPTSGTIVLRARVVNAGYGSSSIRFEGRPAGSGQWQDLGCSDNGVEASCSFNSAIAPDGLYDLRAVAHVSGWRYTYTYTDTQFDIVVDNTAPIVSLSVPAGTLSGTVNLAASVSDALAGVASVRFDYRRSGGSWTTCGDAESAPFGCSLATVDLADGSYDFRATATDAAGNVTTTSSVSRVVDNTDPTVALAVPAGPLSGTVNLSATASDASGVDSVRFEHRLQGAGSWSTCGTDSSAPYTCSLDTLGLANGTHEFRATATDNVGRTATTAVQTATVSNVSLKLAALPTAVKATTSLSATWVGSSSTSVVFERQTGGTGSWTTICTVTAAPTAVCSWNPANPNLSDGSYTIRARTTFQSTSYSQTQSVLLDRTAPSSVSLTVPAAPLTGTVELTAAASDATSGIASVLFEYKLSSASTWATCGSATSAPYTCSLDTGTLTDASYNFRATGFDVAGNSRVSSTVTRAVTTTSVSVTSPASGSSILGTTTVTADASANKPISSVALKYRTGSGSWTTICTDTSAPYSCSWNTASLAYGSYELQAVMTYSTGSLTSASVPVAVERFRGYSVDATSGSNKGLPGTGDTVVLTYTSTVDLGTIKSGWNGSTTGIDLYLIDKGFTYLSGPVSGKDWMYFAGVDLGAVAFDQNYVDDGRYVGFGNATMTATTVTVNGRQATQITVSLGAATSNTSDLNDTNNTTGTMRWLPSSDTKETSGNTILAELVTETGSLDADL